MRRPRSALEQRAQQVAADAGAHVAAQLFAERAEPPAQHVAQLPAQRARRGGRHAFDAALQGPALALLLLFLLFGGLLLGGKAGFLSLLLRRLLLRLLLLAALQELKSGIRVGGGVVLEIQVGRLDGLIALGVVQHAHIALGRQPRPWSG